MSNKREDLLESKAALDGAWAAVKKQVKAAQKRLRSQWRFPKLVQRVALILYDKGQHGLAAATAFLTKEAQKRQWPAKPEDEVRRFPEDWFLEVDVNEFAALCDAANPADLAAMRLATKFWQEWSLAAWVEEANLDKGVAPPTAAVLDHCEHLRAAAPQPVRPAAKGVMAQGKARAWAWRFRKRFGFIHGAIPTKDDMPVPELNEKAGSGNNDGAALRFQLRSHPPQRDSIGFGGRALLPGWGHQFGFRRGGSRKALDPAGGEDFQAIVDPLFGSEGQFCGRDFSSDFGHHFDDTTSGFIYDLICGGPFWVIVLMTQIWPKIPTGNESQHPPNSMPQKPKVAAQIANEMPPLGRCGVAMVQLRHQLCSAGLGGLAGEPRRDFGLPFPRRRQGHRPLPEEAARGHSGSGATGELEHEAHMPYAHRHGVR